MYRGGSAQVALYSRSLASGRRIPNAIGRRSGAGRSGDTDVSTAYQQPVFYTLEYRPMRPLGQVRDQPLGRNYVSRPADRPRDSLTPRQIHISLARGCAASAPKCRWSRATPVASREAFIQGCAPPALLSTTGEDLWRDGAGDDRDQRPPPRCSTCRGLYRSAKSGRYRRGTTPPITTRIEESGIAHVFLNTSG